MEIYICWVASDYSVVMYVYVGIVGWIYRTKIDPISILLVPESIANPLNLGDRSACACNRYQALRFSTEYD